MPVVGRPDEGWRRSLYERLCSYGEEDYAPFHMPGHKRQARPGILPEGLPWKIDITEIDGFDNLHHAEGILKESMDILFVTRFVRKHVFHQDLYKKYH